MNLKKSITLVGARVATNELTPLKGPWIGVDRGAYMLAKLNQSMVAAIGDFDSVSKTQYRLIEQYAQHIDRLSTQKKETDMEVALNYAIQQGYNDILIMGGLGGRLDHSLANIMLLMRHRQSNIILQDDDHRIQVLPPGVYEVAPQQFKYLSFFAYVDAVFSVSGVAYPVSQKKLLLGDVYAISNEILSETATVVITEGLLVMIQTYDHFR